MRLRTLTVLLAAVGLLGTTSARAQSDADRTTARSLAREGYEAEKREQYAIAADRFARAEALVHAPTLLLGLARAKVGLGKFVEALEIYQRIVREPMSATAPAPFLKAVDDAKHELAGISPRIAWVTVHVVGPPSAEVTIDDAPVPTAAIGVRRASDPGQHWVRAKADGFAPAERSITLGEGADQTVSLALDRLPAPPDTRTVVLPSMPEARVQSSSMPLQTQLAIASVAVGAVGIVTGVVTGVLTLSKHASLAGACPGDQCTPSHAGELSSYRTIANVSTGAFIVGAVGTGVGIALFATSPKQPSVTAYAGWLGGGIRGAF